MPRKFKLSPLTHLLSEVTTPLIKGEGGLWAQLVMGWPQVVGTFWGEKTYPERLVFPTENNRRGVLHLAVWGKDALELAYEASYLCEKVNQYLGFAAVHQVKWRLKSSPVLTLEVKPDPVSPLPPKDLSPSEEAWVGKHLEHLDEELGRSLYHFGKTLLQQVKMR